jgi:hypothetical protein
MRSVTRMAGLLLLAAFIAPASIDAQQSKAEPKIAITGVPPAGPGGPGPTVEISGTAAGPDLRELRVVIYAHAGELWYVQPTEVSPLTLIDPSTKKWDTDTHYGRTYAALLVRKSFKAAATVDRLPEVGGDVLASDVVAGKRK